MMFGENVFQSLTAHAHPNNLKYHVPATETSDSQFPASIFPSSHDAVIAQDR